MCHRKGNYFLVLQAFVLCTDARIFEYFLSCLIENGYRYYEALGNYMTLLKLGNDYPNNHILQSCILYH